MVQAEFDQLHQILHLLPVPYTAYSVWHCLISVCNAVLHYTHGYVRKLSVW